MNFTGKNKGDNKWWLPGTVVAAFLAMLTAPLPAQQIPGRVSLAWDASPDADVVGYKLYYGRQSGRYDRQVEVGKTLTASVPGLWPDRVYYFVVTAINEAGLESEPSNEVKYPEASAPPPIELPPELPPIFGGVKGTLPAPLESVDTAQPPASQGPEVSFWATDPVDSTIPVATAIGPPVILPDGGISFLVHGPPGKWVGIYSSADLHDWRLEGSAENLTGSMIIDRWATVTGPHRFFRCMEWEGSD